MTLKTGMIVAIATLLLTACGQKPIGKIDATKLDDNTRIAFGRVILSSDIEEDQHIDICLMDSRNEERCGKLLSPSIYVLHEEESPYYGYVALALPPGKTQFTKISAGMYSEYMVSRGLEFIVDDKKPATYFGDITLYVATKEGADKKGRQSRTVNNGKATLEYLQSVNPSLEMVDSYATSLTTSLERYKEVITRSSGGYIIFMPK